MLENLKKIPHLKQIVLLILVLIMVPGVFTLAKFIITEIHAYFVESSEFYFTSNRLKEDTALYQVNNWSGVGSFTVQFSLMSEINNYTYTSYDIPYTVTYTCGTDVNCSADKTSGTIYSASHTDTITITAVPQRTFNENETTTVHVEATSTSPFVKTLKADFQFVVGKKGVTYTVEDAVGQNYTILDITNPTTYCTVTTAFGTYAVGANIDVDTFKTLSTENKAKCISKKITLNFDPNIILLDTTSSLISNSTYQNTTIDNVAYISEITFGMDPMSSQKIRFYKKDPTQNYTYPITNDTSIVTVTVNDPI